MWRFQFKDDRASAPDLSAASAPRIVAALATGIVAGSTLSTALAADTAADTDTDAPTREIVVTATRVPTPVVDIPAGVSVIDRKTIEDRDYTTLTQALSAIPGVRVSQSGGPGGNASVFVRGNNSNAGPGAARRHAAERRLRLLRRIQLRRRHPR